MPKITCVNCKRIVEPKVRAKKSMMPKICPGCAKPVASRSSNRAMRKSK